MLSWEQPPNDPFEMDDDSLSAELEAMVDGPALGDHEDAIDVMASNPPNRKDEKQMQL